MTPMRHAALARLLVQACGGFDEAATACRLAKSRLHEICDPTTPAFMPADVIADLEAYCGQPHYSRAMVEARPATSEIASMMTEACEMVEAAAGVMSKIRAATADGVVTPIERRAIEKALLAMAQQLSDVSLANARAAGGAS